MNIESTAFDRSHIWHPYASIGNPPPVNFAVSAKGTQITLAGRKRTHRRRFKLVVRRPGTIIRRSSRPSANRRKMTHVMFARFTHGPVELAERLCGFLPAGLDKIFFRGFRLHRRGSRHKMAVQYQHAKGFGKKCKLVALKGAYHGDTAGRNGALRPGRECMSFSRNNAAPLFCRKAPHAVRGPLGRFRYGVVSNAPSPNTETKSRRSSANPYSRAGNAMWVYHAIASGNPQNLY